MKDFVSKNKVVLLLFFVFIFISMLLPGFFTDRIALHQILNQFHSRFFDLFFTYATYLGDGILLVPIIVYFLFFRDFNYGLQLLFLSIVLLLLSQFFKHFVFDDINRPYFAFKNMGESLRLVLSKKDMHSYHSFPSGHTTTAFSLFLYFSFTIAKTLPSKVFCFFLALIAGLSRVYLSQHFLEDVVAGSFLGLFISILTFWLFNEKIFQKEKYNKGLIAIFAKEN